MRSFYYRVATTNPNRARQRTKEILENKSEDRREQVLRYARPGITNRKRTMKVTLAGPKC